MVYLEGMICMFFEELMKKVKEWIEDIVKGIEIGFCCKGKVIYLLVYY